MNITPPTSLHSTDSSDKVKREQDFHNEWAKSIDLDKVLVHEAFESPTAIENRRALEILGDLKGKKILDLGCGAGEAAVYFALKGADVYACDIAEECLKIAKALAQKSGVSLNLASADTACLPYAENHFDLVYANGVLHHVDFVPAVKEISRVLKSGGKAVFVEPLPYNPVINIYRRMAQEVRTQDERPVTFKQVREMKPFFRHMEHSEFWLFSLTIFLHFYFVRRWNPSKVRYWKKVLEEGQAYKKSFARLQKLDGFILKYLPFLRPLCWTTVISAVK